IACGDELQRNGTSGLGAEFDADAALVAVAAQEHRSPFPPLIPTGWAAGGKPHPVGTANALDFDHIGAQGTEGLGRERTGRDRGEVGYPYVGQRKFAVIAGGCPVRAWRPPDAAVVRTG